MLMHNRTTAPLPCSEQDAAVSTLVVDVLEAGHEIWDTAEAEDEADEDTPDVCSVSRNIFSPRKSSLATDGAVDGRSSFLEISERNSGLVCRLLLHGLLHRHCVLMHRHLLLLRGN